MEPARKQLKRYDNGMARFVTFSTFRRLPLFQHDTIKDRFVESLASSKCRHSFELYAWVIMPEHVHIVLRHAEKPLAPVLASMKSGFAKSVIARWRELDAPILRSLAVENDDTRFWQRGGGYDRNIRNKDEFREKVNYIHFNPVRRELVSCPSDWKWSSSRWYAGDESGPVRIDRLPR